MAQPASRRRRKRRPASSSPIDRADHVRDHRPDPRGATRSSSIAPPRPSKGQRPILVFEFLPGETAPGSSEFGACYDLANLISKDLAGAKLTVAYVPQPLQGYAVLPAVACTEIVMGSSASLGPITPEGQPFDAAYREPVRFLAIRKTRDPDLLLGMLDRDADLRLVRTADKTVHYVLAENLQGLPEDPPGHRRAAGLGGRPARRPDREAGARGGLLQADRREPGRAREHLPDRRPVGRRRPDPGPVDPPGLDQARRPARHRRWSRT